MRGAVVGELLGLRRDGDGRRVDRQRPGLGRDDVAGGHVLVAVHDLVAGLDRVVARRGVGHVGGGAAGGRHELVAGEQLALGHGDRGVRQGAAVVGLGVVGGLDGDLDCGVGHRELAVGGGHAVVAGRAGGELVARQLVDDRALARERDRAGHGRGDRVVAHEAVDVVLGPTLRLARVGEGVALGRDGDGLRVDRQLAVDLGDHVAVGHVGAIVRDLVARDLVLALVAYVGGGAGGGRHELVTREQSARGQLDARSDQLGAVVGLGVAGRGNRDGLRRVRHRQLAVGSGHAVVAGRAGDELVARELVDDRALARERDLAGHDRADLVADHEALDVVLGPALGRARVSELMALGRDGHGRRVDLERAVLGLDRELARDIATLGILDHGRAADLVDQRCDVDARRIGRGEALNGVGVAVDREREGLEAFGGLWSAVIGVAGVGLGHNLDLILLSTVGDGQLAGRLGRQRVIGGDILLAIHDLEVVAIRARVRARERALGGRVGDGRRLAGEHVGEHRRGLALVLVAVIFDRSGVFDLDGDGLRFDRQRAGLGRDDVVLSHVDLAVHDLVAFGDRVVARRGVGHVGGRAGRGGHELVAGEQLALGHGNRGVSQGGAVVGLGAVSGLDGDGLLGLRHRQLAVHLGDGVVAGRTRSERVAVNHVRNRALTRERDRAGHGRGDGVSAHEADDVVLGPALRLAGVGEGVALGRDGDARRSDRQRALGRGILIVRVRRLYYIGKGTHVGDARGGGAPRFAIVGAVTKRGALGQRRSHAAGMRGAVVSALVIHSLQRHGHLLDLQPAVGVGVGRVLLVEEIAAGVDRKVGERQPHLIGPDRSALGLSRLAGLQRHADASRSGNILAGDLVSNREAGDGLLGAGERLDIGVADDLHGELRLPHGEQVLVRLLLVSGDIARGIARHVRVFRAVPHEEVSARAALRLGPTEELVARARRRSEDLDVLVDLDVFVRMIKLTLAVVLVAIVGIPVDVRRGLFLDVLILRLQLNNIFVLSSLIDVVRRDDLARLGVRDLRAVLANRDCRARKNLGVAVDELAAVPRLQHPTIEDLAFGSGRRSANAHGGVVLIQRRVARRVRAAVCIIENADAVGADEHRAPFGVDVVFPRDPETVDVVVRSRPVAPLVHGVGHVRGLVIRRGDRRVVEHRVLREHAAEILIGVPTIELIARARPVGSGEFSAIADAEVHLLALVAPIERVIVGRNVRMQERTILDLAPLGENGQTALGHLVKRVLRRASAVDVPALENVTGRSGRGVVISAIRIVRFQARIKSDIADRLELTLARFRGDAVVVAVVIRAVHEVEGVLVARVVAGDGRRSTATPSIIRGVAILRETDEIEVVLGLGEVTVIRGDALMENEVLAVKRNGAGLARKRLEIVVDGLRGVRRGIQMERDAFRRHDVDVDQNLFVSRAVLRLPALAIVVRHAIGPHNGEVVADGLPIKGLDLLDGRPAGVVLITSAGVRVRICVSRIKPALPFAVLVPHAIVVVNLRIAVAVWAVLRPAIVLGRGINTLNLELQRVLVAIPINVDDRVALGSDRLARLIRLLEVEAGLTSIRRAGHPPVAGDDIRRRTDGGVPDDNRLDEVVAVARDVLLPNENRVIGFRLRRPMRVNSGGLGDSAAEGERLPVLVIPAIERVAVPHHLEQASVAGGLARLDEPRGIVGRALAVLVENKPMTLGGADGEFHVTADRDLGVVRKQRVRRDAGRAHDVAQAVGDMPTLEVVGGVRRITLVELVGRLGVANRKLGRLGADDDAAAIDIGDGVMLEERRIIGDFLVRGQGVGLFHGRSADVLNGIHRRSRRILAVRRPALEHLAFGNGAHARIVDDLGDLVFGVSGLDDHRRGLGGTVLELDGEPRDGAFFGLDDDVDGERVGGEGGRAALQRVEAHGFGRTVVGDVDDADVLGLIGVGVGDHGGAQAHGDVARGLDLDAVLVAERDVDGLGLRDLAVDRVLDRVHDLRGGDGADVHRSALGEGALGSLDGDADAARFPGKALRGTRRLLLLGGRGRLGVAVALLGAGRLVGLVGLGIRLLVGRLALGVGLLVGRLICLVDGCGFLRRRRRLRAGRVRAGIFLRAEIRGIVHEDLR